MTWGMDLTETLWLGFGFVSIVLIVILAFSLAKRMRPGSGSGDARISEAGLMDPTQIGKLASKGVLTPEEAKAVRAAMARQFLREQEERERAKDSRQGIQGLSAEQILAIAAETAAPKPEVPPPPRAPDIPPPEERYESLPPRLRAMASRSLADLDALVQSGALTWAEYQLILDTKENA